MAQNAINNVQFTSVNIVTFTSNGTYTPPSNLVCVQVECIGGGGGSGGCAATGAGQMAATGGGGGGSFAMGNISASALGGPVAVTVGSGGVGGAAGANTGNNGGTTQFGTFVQAGGGSGSPGNTAGAGIEFPLAGAGGTASVGNSILIDGGAGWKAVKRWDANQLGITPGWGGFAPRSGECAPNRVPGAYGSGAPGVTRIQSQAAIAGLNAASGIVIITQFVN